MAEAFGLAAGVLQVAGFGAEVGSALWTCAKKIRYADEELRDLAAQVEATAKCLRGVGSLLDDPDTKALHTSKLYDDTSAVSKGCYEVFLELDKAVKKINDGKSKISMIQRLQWPLNSDKLTEPLKILRNYNDVLHLMLTVLHIVEGRRAATSDELQTLGENLQRLTTSNEYLSQSNKALTDILSSQKQITQKRDPVNSNSSLSTQARGIDGPVGGPFVSLSAIPTPRDNFVQPPQPNSTDAMHDHLQRCMDSVQELANTIACAMSAWQGGEKTGSSDIHGSHDKVIEELGKLSRELKCQECSGKVSWANFDLVKAAHRSLGSCTCQGRTHSSLWTPHAPSGTHFVSIHARRRPDGAVGGYGPSMPRWEEELYSDQENQLDVDGKDAAKHNDTHEPLSAASGEANDNGPFDSNIERHVHLPKPNSGGYTHGPNVQLVPPAGHKIKKKGDNFTLEDFLADQSLGSWADETDDQPQLPAVPRFASPIVERRKSSDRAASVRSCAAVESAAASVVSLRTDVNSAPPTPPRVMILPEAVQVQIAPTSVRSRLRTIAARAKWALITKRRRAVSLGMIAAMPGSSTALECSDPSMHVQTWLHSTGHSDGADYGSDFTSSADRKGNHETPTSSINENAKDDPSVQALLSRWLGENASAVLAETPIWLRLASLE